MQLIENFKRSQFYQRKSPNLMKLGFDFSGNLETEFLKIQSMLYTEYHIKCESMLTLMKKFSIPSSRTMDIIFKLFDIESRNCSSRTKVAIDKNRWKLHDAITFKTIYHTSWTGEIFCLRSSHEEEYAKILDDKKISYKVEPFRIKYFDEKEKRFRISVPDFYLPENNTIVEVKSTYWLDLEQMKNKKEAYLKLGYKLNLFLDHKLLENW